MRWRCVTAMMRSASPWTAPSATSTDPARSVPFLSRPSPARPSQVRCCKRFLRSPDCRISDARSEAVEPPPRLGGPELIFEDLGRARGDTVEDETSEEGGNRDEDE